MRDRIDISGLRGLTIVGALPHGPEIPQSPQIDLSIEVDLPAAGVTDELDDTVHYGEVADRVVAIAEESKVVLLERLVARIAETVPAFRRVEAVDAVSTLVRIRRSRIGVGMVVGIETTLDLFALLRRCQRIEAKSMRQRVVRWGPRILGVDLVLCDEAVIESPDLELPHPRFAERRFVLLPLSEIAPDLCPDGWDEWLAPAGVHPRGPLGLS